MFNNLEALRSNLKKLKIDGFIVPHSDEYQSEFLAPYSERLAWLTGFTGSAGTAIILMHKAALFVDGRYILQVQTEIDVNKYEIFNISDKKPKDWLEENISNYKVLALDPRLHTPETVGEFENIFTNSDAELIKLDHNPIDSVWEDQPEKPSGIVKIHPLKFSGESHHSKLDVLSESLKKHGFDAYLITSLESQCWLLNLRGSDSIYTPLIQSTTLFLSTGEVFLFIEPSKITDQVRRHLSPNIYICSPDSLYEKLLELKKFIKLVSVDRLTASCWHVDIIQKSGLSFKLIDDPCSMPRACKNDCEISGIRSCHQRDGVALTKFLEWLDNSCLSGEITELEASEKLEEFRFKNELYQGPSFATISASGGNGAIVHYHASDKTNSKILANTLYLVDSGGQYLDGTTDVTRTVAIGNPTSEQKKRFTQVLKGHIALACAKFPRGTCGGHLDAYARSFLWADGVDYDHGTGHGVGSYLSVHEGPQRISKGSLGSELKPGMILSNEPGYYKKDEYGIRIENLVCVRVSDVFNNYKNDILEFETITLAPIDKRLIDVFLLDQKEKTWINEYHSRVFSSLRFKVEGTTVKWLEKATDLID